MLRIAVIGHVEHVTIGRVVRTPSAGEIAHLGEVDWFPGGGGGVAFWQLTRSDAEVHLFTAIGHDEAGVQVRQRLGSTGACIHDVHRDAPHTRDVVMVDDDGERTIVVVGRPLHPTAADDLPWDSLSTFDAVYFTAQDPALIRRARAAPRLVITARRQPALRESGVTPDVVVGSRADPREVSGRADYARPPAAIVMTEGADGGTVQTADTLARFAAPRVDAVVGTYGAGDSFAGALTYFVAEGLPALEAAQAAAAFGAAVLAGANPLPHQRRLARSRRVPGAKTSKGLGT